MYRECARGVSFEENVSSISAWVRIPDTNHISKEMVKVSIMEKEVDISVSSIGFHNQIHLKHCIWPLRSYWTYDKDELYLELVKKESILWHTLFATNDDHCEDFSVEPRFETKECSLGEYTVQYLLETSRVVIDVPTSSKASDIVCRLSNGSRDSFLKPTTTELSSTECDMVTVPLKQCTILELSWTDTVTHTLCIVVFAKLSSEVCDRSVAVSDKGMHLSIQSKKVAECILDLTNSQWLSTRRTTEAKLLHENHRWSLCCRVCHASILSSGVANADDVMSEPHDHLAVKCLPSALWGEWCEISFCDHNPLAHMDNAQKNEQFNSHAGKVMVGETSVFVHPSDCPDVVYSSSPSDCSQPSADTTTTTHGTMHDVRCNQCGSVLGRTHMNQPSDASITQSLQSLHQVNLGECHELYKDQLLCKEIPWVFARYSCLDRLFCWMMSEMTRTSIGLFDIHSTPLPSIYLHIVNPSVVTSDVLSHVLHKSIQFSISTHNNQSSPSHSLPHCSTTISISEYMILKSELNRPVLLKRDPQSEYFFFPLECWSVELMDE